MSALAKDRLDLRIDTETKLLAERAAAVLSSSMTELVTRLIRENAPQIIAEHANIQLSNAQFDQFLEICEAEETAQAPARLIEAARLLDKEGF